MSAALMLQGTGSDVGKSALVAGLCRLFANLGYAVRPFKPQNMSNNAAVTVDGGEIGRAQALQALACRVSPVTDMNPVLLKPESDGAAQVVVQGRMRGRYDAMRFFSGRQTLLPTVLESFDRLRGVADLVIVEGAGSPAETNLRARDIANMGFARAAGVPVVLVGDIDRGGVIAALAGTRAVLAPDDAALVQGFLINKFRGDVRLFEDGYRDIERLTGWPGLGIIPWLPVLARLPAEDAVTLERPGAGSDGRRVIAVPMLSRIANFDDFDPLRQEPEIDLRFVPPGRPLPLADLVILPGTKATIADLHFLRAQGWDIDLRAHHRRGGQVLGICGGYQMLGRRLEDPLGIEGTVGGVDGLGLLDVVTTMRPTKRLHAVSGVSLADGAAFSGYEMHVGDTAGPDGARPLLALDSGRYDGAVSRDGRVAGCYVHGLFNATAQRAAWLARLGAASAGADHDALVDAALDDLAAALAARLDVAALARIAGLPDGSSPPGRTKIS